jgi:hypothetical protein
MSTWTSKALIVSLLLSGCVLPDSTGGGPRQSIAVAGLKVAGPAGFCPLPDTEQRVSGADFVAFAPCAGEAGAILAATIGAETSAAGITLKQSTLGPYFATSEGKAALRGAGNQDDISVHEVADYQAAVVLRLTRDSGQGPSDSWRALMQVNGRLVTLSVRPRQGQTITTQAGRKLIEQFVDALRGANRP